MSRLCYSWKEIPSKEDPKQAEPVGENPNVAGIPMLKILKVTYDSKVLLLFSNGAAVWFLMGYQLPVWVFL